MGEAAHVGGFLAAAKAHTQRHSAAFAVSAVAVLAVAFLVMFFAVSQAQGSGEEDTSTLGVGSTQVSTENQISAEDRASATVETEADLAVDETVEATQSAQRSITVKDPDPVVVPLAVDTENSKAVAKADEVCTTNPLPTAPHVAPDVNDGTWSVGVASAYDIASSSTVTASGRALTNSCVTVAVPASESYLVGRIVEICYNGEVVIATVTDTGGFAKYGRALDLAPGVFKAYGANSCFDWGTRTIYYRFL